MEPLRLPASTPFVVRHLLRLQPGPLRWLQSINSDRTRLIEAVTVLSASPPRFDTRRPTRSRLLTLPAPTASIVPQCTSCTVTLRTRENQLSRKCPSGSRPTDQRSPCPLRNDKLDRSIEVSLSPEWSNTNTDSSRNRKAKLQTRISPAKKTCRLSNPCLSAIRRSTSTRSLRLRRTRNSSSRDHPIATWKIIDGRSDISSKHISCPSVSRRAQSASHQQAAQSRTRLRLASANSRVMIRTTIDDSGRT